MCALKLQPYPDLQSTTAPGDPTGVFREKAIAPKPVFFWLTLTQRCVIIFYKSRRFLYEEIFGIIHGFCSACSFCGMRRQ
jgi:hypothetical protein